MAQVLLHEPDVLIMDEPTAGLDPNQIHHVRDMIQELGQTKTILLSTHILQEVEFLCSHVVLIDQGRIVFDNAVDDMGARDEMERKFHQLTRFAVSVAAAAT